MQKKGNYWESFSYAFFEIHALKSNIFFLAIKRKRKSFRLIIVVLCLIPVVFLVLVLKVVEGKKFTFKWCNFIHWSILISVIAKWLTILKRQICLVCIALLWRNQFLEICKRRWWEFRLGMHEEICCQKEFALFLPFPIVCYNFFFNDTPFFIVIDYTTFFNY